jgi:hypothetical protein
MAGVTEPPWRSRFYLASRKCGTSQLHLFKHAPDISAMPPIADVSLRRSEPPLQATSGLMQCSKRATFEPDHLIVHEDRRLASLWDCRLQAEAQIGYAPDQIL